MEFNRDVTSTPKPPMLNGSNCTYWKVRMIVFLSIEDDVWDCVEVGYSAPTVFELFPNTSHNGPMEKGILRIGISRQSMLYLME